LPVIVPILLHQRAKLGEEAAELPVGEVVAIRHRCDAQQLLRRQRQFGRQLGRAIALGALGRPRRSHTRAQPAASYSAGSAMVRPCQAARSR